MITNSFLKNTALNGAAGAASGDIPLGNPQIQSQRKNKFSNGWLSGVGSSSQFTQFTTLPIAPASSNYDLDARIIGSLGVNNPGTTLLPGWQQSKAWNVGLGQDALLSGITRTPYGAGQQYAVTGVIGPNVNAGLDLPNRNPITPFNASAQNGLSFSAGNTPVSILGSSNTEGWTNPKTRELKRETTRLKRATKQQK